MSTGVRCPTAWPPRSTWTATITADLDKPFMMMAAVNTRGGNPDAQEFWTHLTGWRRYVQLNGAEHLSFTDVEGIIAPAAKLLGLSRQDVQGYIGTMSGSPGPTPEFPSVRFIA